MAQPTESELWQMLDRADAAGDQAGAQDIMQMITEQQQAAVPTPSATADELPPGRKIDRVVEPLQAMGAGFAGSVVGGWKGIGEALTGGSRQDFKRAVLDTQKEFNQWGAPETQAGEQAMQTIGELAEKGIDMARVPLASLAGVVALIGTQDADTARDIVRSVEEKGLGDTIFDRVYDATGDDLTAAVASAVPEALGMLAPSHMALASHTAKPVTEPIKRTPVRQTVHAIAHPVEATRRTLEARKTSRQEMAQAIKEGRGDPRIAGYILDGTGRARKDPNLGALADEAVRQGFDRGAVAAVQGATRTDKDAMKKMLTIKKRGDADKLYKMNNRPADVAGNVVANRVRFLRKLNRDTGKELDGVAKGLKGQRVDFSNAVDNFNANLDEMGVSFDRNLNPIFKGSDVEGSPAAQNLIKKVVKFMKDPGRGANPDAYDVHRLKKFIDETVTYGKNAEGLAGRAEIVVKNLRRDADTVLDQAFPDYNRVNTTYADTIGALNAMQDVAGRKMDISGQYADSNIGQLMRRLMSNAVSRNNVADAIDTIESTYLNYGGDVAHNPRVLMMFADELDSVFGPAAETSFLGESVKAAKLGAEAAAGGRGAARAVAETIADVTEGIRGVNPENAYRTIDRFIDYGLD